MNFYTSLKNILGHQSNINAPLKTILKVIWWQCNRYFFKLPVIVKVTSSKKLVCYPDSSYGSYVLYTTEPEYLELEFVKKYLKNKDTMIDVGSHIGHYSVVASEKIQQGTIVAFEPTPKNCQRILENFRLNDIESIARLEQSALSNKSGTAKFIVNHESEINRLESNADVEKDTILVTTIKLDTYCKKNKITNIDVLKIDTEGFELQVLQGCENMLLTKRIKTILFELNPKTDNFQKNMSEIFKILDQGDFHYYVTSDNKWKKKISKNISPTETTNVLAVLNQDQIKTRAKLAMKL